MLSQTLLRDLTRLAYPGITTYYSELKNAKDPKTITDNNGELSKVLSTKNQKDIALIIEAVYNNTKYKGELVDDKGTIRIIKDGKLYDLKIINTGSTLKITDTLNNKTTTIEYKASSKQETTKPLQDQLIETLKKRKMSDKEVIEFVKQWSNNIK
jgi:hypothetical protein